MLRWESPYIGFNDKRFTFIGFLVIFLLVPPLFTEYTYWEYVKIPPEKFLIAFMMTFSLWFFSRAALIWSRRKYGNDEDYWKRVIMIVVSVLIGALLIEAVVTGFMKLLDQIFQLKILKGHGNGSIVITYFIAFGVLGIYETVYYFNKYIESVQQRKELEKTHVAAQLQHLQQQLNPHFLFNSLNTLMSLIPDNPDKAMRYLGKLSTFYRYAVSNQESLLIPLDQELEHVHLYVELLTERFGNSLNVTITLSDTQGVYIFPMGIQLLIENAIKHNALSKSEPLQITINHSEDREHIVVRNNIQPRIEQITTTGTGLQNLRNRYAFHSGLEIDITKDAESFTVKIPIIEQL